jgi:anti-sigma regulatory factor (Ser/Thr protein kinase)
VKEITLDATVENIQTVTEFINQELQKLNCSSNVQAEIDIALDELFGNVANYAYNPDVGTVTVRIEATEKPISVDITFIDKGVPYNPLEQEAPDITLSAEERPIGGLGIYLVKQMMDTVSYEYVNDSNVLTFRKLIQ